MVPASVDPVTDDLDDLREHDREVLEFLSRDPQAQVAFQGIRRRLGIHPEQLSRALHRLGDDGLVQKTDVGYRVTPKALQYLSPQDWSHDPPGTTVLQTYLPADVDLRALVVRLRGSWIGPLRWYGLSESDQGLRLSWVLEDGSIHLETHVGAGQLSVVARVSSVADLDEAARLSHLLFRQIAGEVSRLPVSGLIS